MLADNMLRLVLFCKCLLIIMLPTFLWPAFQPLLQPNYTGLFEHPLPTTNPHNHHDCQYHTKTPCYYNPRQGDGGQRELFYVNRGYSHSHCIYFYVILFRCFYNFVHVTIIQVQQGELIWTVDRFFFFFFLQRESRSLVPVREPEGRARDPARVTEPPALNQRDTRCVISHTNTHTQRD